VNRLFLFPNKIEMLFYHISVSNLIEISPVFKLLTTTMSDYQLWCADEMKRKAELKSERKRIHKKLSKVMDELMETCDDEADLMDVPYEITSMMYDANEIYSERICDALNEIHDRFNSQTPPDVEDIKQYYFDEISNAIDTYTCRHILSISPITLKRCVSCDTTECKPTYLLVANRFKQHIRDVLDYI